jgi:hypothetical protein
VIRTRTGDGGREIWMIAQCLTDRWGALNDSGRNTAAVQALAADPTVLERLRGQLSDAWSCIVRKDGAFGTLLEIEYQTLERTVRHHDASQLRSYEEVAQVILLGIQDLAIAFPEVQFAVPDSEVVDGRPVAWVYVPDGALNLTQRRALLGRMHIL